MIKNNIKANFRMHKISLLKPETAWDGGQLQKTAGFMQMSPPALESELYAHAGLFPVHIKYILEIISTQPVTKPNEKSWYNNHKSGDVLSFRWIFQPGADTVRVSGAGLIAGFNSTKCSRPCLHRDTAASPWRDANPIHSYNFPHHHRAGLTLWQSVGFTHM